MLFADLLSLHLVTFLMFFILVYIRFQEVSRALLWHSGAFYNLALVSRASFYFLQSSICVSVAEVFYEAWCHF